MHGSPPQVRRLPAVFFGIDPVEDRLHCAEPYPSLNCHTGVWFRRVHLLDYLLRFAAGGLIVSAFAVLGDVLRPKSFAGLFGAAPSVALATLSLAF
jgi:hypothetical protein